MFLRGLRHQTSLIRQEKKGWMREIGKMEKTWMEGKQVKSRNEHGNLQKGREGKE